ncbi:Uncharacterised protein [Mycobacteroides abscessus subsp. massiliense]|nr:Uncharacterised protein [Mycobacteroides abscessus subsp. massiliense]SLC50336.1 Uncharacterised protein [Mycobacteroides abscessus subsp. massiliense]
MVDGLVGAGAHVLYRRRAGGGQASTATKPLRSVSGLAKTGAECLRAAGFQLMLWTRSTPLTNPDAVPSPLEGCLCSQTVQNLYSLTTLNW